MRSPAFQINQIVCLDPTPDEKGPKGKVIAIIHYANHYEYLVSAPGKFTEGGIQRHFVHEAEISSVLVPVDFSDGAEKSVNSVMRGQ